MKTVTFNEREIKTNLGGDYAVVAGDNKKTMRMELKDRFNETDREMFERLAKRGYNRITFYEVTTRVKGLHDLIAYCK